MATQKDIAKALGIVQATVSMALRGDRSISAEMREKVRKTAEEMGYHFNPHLSEMMSAMHSSRKASSQGVIGLLVADQSQKSWYQIETYRLFHQGVLEKGKDLGFRVDSFFLQQPGMSDSKIDRILLARGIKGLILAPPYHGNRTLKLQWDRYASVAGGFGWEKQELNRVAYDHFQNYIMAFHELRQLGYKRIGTVLDKIFVHGTRRGFRWYSGYLDCQNGIPESEKIPIMIGDYPPLEETTSTVWDKLGNRFREWFLKWKPDALLTMIGNEKRWLESMGLQVPRDVGIACLSRQPDSDFSGIDEMVAFGGGATVEQVAADIAHNNFGVPSIQKTILIEGKWVAGTSTSNRN